MYPEPKVLQACKENRKFRVIVQLLLVENAILKKKLISLISQHLVCQTMDYKQSGIIDILMQNIDNINGKSVIALLLQIQKFVLDYNKDLQFTKFEVVDQEIIQQDAKIKNSIFLRYLPLPFVRFLNSETNPENIFKIFTAENHKSPELIWTREMLEHLNCQLKDHLEPIIKNLKIFALNKSGRITENMPIYSTPFTSIIKYPQISGEIRCAEYYLTTGGLISTNNEQINGLAENLQRTLQGMVADTFDIDKLEIIFNSLMKALNRYFCYY